MSKPVIAAFDFDETLISRDTLFDFLTHSFSIPTIIKNTFLFLPVALRYVGGRINNSQAKERLLTLYIRGLPLQEFTDICDIYKKRLTRLEAPTAIKRLEYHQALGHQVLIISASAENWIKPWAQLHGITEVIATKLEVSKGVMTGKLASPNCHSEQKVIRIQAAYPNLSDYELYVYGDGKSDQQLLDIADHPFLGRFS